MENTKKIIEAFFNTNDKIVYGFIVLQKFYENICTIIYENETKTHKIYPLLSSLNGSMRDVFNHVDLSCLCDGFRWMAFTQNVLTASDFMSPNEKYAEIQTLIQFNKLIGKRLANCELEVKKRWYDYLCDFECVGVEQKFQEIVSRCFFSFLQSQILFDNHNLVSTHFYKKLLKKKEFISECFVHVFLLTSCYLYYLGCREDECYVNNRDRDLRSRSKMIIEESIDEFKAILETIAYRDKKINSVASFNPINIFNANLFSYMKTSLRSCEHFFIDESKKLIMDNVVDEFISHSLVFVKYIAPYLNIDIDKVIGNEQAENLFIMLKNDSDVNKSHESFLRFFNSIRYEKNYKLFIKALENIYKRNLLKKNLKSINENYRNIEEKILKHISDALGQQKNDMCANYATTILLSNVSISNDIELENIVDSFIGFILEKIISSLYNRMKKNNEANFFKRLNLDDENFFENSRIDDKNVIELIENHKGHIYIGSDSLILPNDISFYWNRYNNAVKGFSKKYNVAGCLGVFIDPAQFKIFIKNISISRAIKTIQDSNAKEIDGKYEYAPTGMKMTFTKEELEEVLKSNERILTITADVGYDIAPETKVDFIFMDM